MIPQVLVPLAHGFEEIEAVCPIDLLRRSEIEVITASCESGLEVCGRSGIVIKCDIFLVDSIPNDFDLLVLSGGPAVFELRKNEAFLSFVQEFERLQRPIGAICAAPLILGDLGILNSKRYTAHFSTANELPRAVKGQEVVQDGHVITSPGAGTAIEFGLRLVELLRGKEMAESIRASIHA